MKQKIIITVTIIACITLAITIKPQQQFPKIEEVKNIEVKGNVLTIIFDDGSKTEWFFTRMPTVEEIKYTVKINKELKRLSAIAGEYRSLLQTSQVYNELINNKITVEVEKTSKNP